MGSTCVAKGPGEPCCGTTGGRTSNMCERPLQLRLQLRTELRIRGLQVAVVLQQSRVPHLRLFVGAPASRGPTLGGRRSVSTHLPLDRRGCLVLPCRGEQHPRFRSRSDWRGGHICLGIAIQAEPRHCGSRRGAIGRRCHRGRGKEMFTRAMLICPPMEGWKHGCAAIRLHRLVLWLSTSARTYRVVFLLGPSSAAWVVRPCPTVPARRLLPPPPLQYQRLPCSRPRPPQTARARTARQASRRNRRLGVHGRHRRTGMMRLGCTHGWQDILSLGRQTRRKRVLAATMVKRSIQRALSVASAIFCNSYLR